MIEAATAAVALQVVAVETLAVALVEVLQVQVRRRLRPISLALLDQVLTVSAVAPAVQPTARSLETKVAG
jgi:hypothetical protein